MPPEPASVLFQVPARGIGRLAMRRFARQLQESVTKGLSFSCLITSDTALREWNRQFRKKDYPTDVLSFPAQTSVDGIGELAISLDRAKEQAAEQGHTVEQELQILMLHGVLHLTGLDHERDAGEMARTERRWRRKFLLPAGLIERVGA